MFDVLEIRKDFPILNQTVYGMPLVYLDNAATTQMPRDVLDSIVEHYTSYNANVHRGLHYLSEQSTMHMEKARNRVLRFINGADSGELIFTSGATESINLVAQSFVRSQLHEGDKILVSELEHHSNFVVWQQLCKECGADFQVIPVTDGDIDMDELNHMLDEHVKFLAVTAVSNLIGTVTDIKQIIELAHKYEIPVLIDAAQAMRHLQIDVAGWDCDFLCFSGHKMMAPSGTGGVYINKRHLSQMRPYQYGGGMVDQVSAADTSFGDIPHRMEAGTPNISGNIALGAAVDYLEKIGMDSITDYEAVLLEHTQQVLDLIPEVEILGRPKNRAGAISFVVSGIHPYDLASLLDKQGIALRSGTHCAQPMMKKLDVKNALRVSPAFYNTTDEIQRFGEALKASIQFLKKWS